jgi:hypothetical protein
MSEYVTLYAAKHDRLNILCWLRSLDPPCPLGQAAAEAAAEEGHLEILQWVCAQQSPGVQQSCQWKSERTSYTAAKNGHLHILQWIKSQYPECAMNRSAIRSVAVANEDADMVEWLDSLQ